MKKLIIAATLISIFSASPVPALQNNSSQSSPGTIEIRAGQFIVRAAEELEAPARRIADQIPGMVKRISMEFGIDLQGRGEVILMASEDPGTPFSDRARSMPSWAAGQSLSGTGVILLRLDRIGSYGQREVGTVLAHELAHMLVSSVLPHHGAELPIWFREGTASMAARQGELRDYWHLWTTSLTSTSHPFAELEAGFSRGQRLDMAYAGSLAAVTFLRREYGNGIVPVILEETRKGVPFREAFRRATGVSMAGAARAWMADLRRPRRWVIWIGSAATLWIGMSLLIFIAYTVKKRRSRRKIKLWEEEEVMTELIRRGHSDDSDDETVH
jgi:hypothetical protein